MGAFLTYALDESDALIHVDDVVKGNNCKCYCPHCGAPLCAKNAGKQRQHHFAHTHGHECEGAYESQLHLLAKEILQEIGQIMLPKSLGGTFPSGLVQIHNIQVEKWDEKYHIKPDVEGIMDNGERLLIEFLVSHKVDGKKRQIIVDNHLKCVEIDINFLALDRSELKEFLTCSDEDRKWIVSVPPRPQNSDESFSYGRNPRYEKTRDILRDVFNDGTLLIRPYEMTFTHPDRVFDLRRFGYDVCEVGTKYRGFKSDLLLYRSQKDKKEYISINIRGRRRSIGFKHPKELRIIDIILGSISNEEVIKERLSEGDLASGDGITVYYEGFKK